MRLARPPASCSEREAKAKANQKRKSRSGESGSQRVEVEGQSRESRELSSVKYFIETYGCQMNVHDSERMAGSAGAGGLRGHARRARCGCRRHQHLQRARARRREAVHAPRRDSRQASERQGARPSSPSPAAWLSRKAARCSKRSTADRCRRRHAEPEAAAGARRAGRRRRRAAAAHRRQRLRGRVVSARRRAAARSGQGVRHDHRRLQRVLFASAWCRTRAATSACGRSATSSTK